MRYLSEASQDAAKNDAGSRRLFLSIILSIKLERNRLDAGERTGSLSRSEPCRWTVGHAVDCVPLVSSESDSAVVFTRPNRFPPEGAGSNGLGTAVQMRASICGRCLKGLGRFRLAARAQGQRAGL